MKRLLPLLILSLAMLLAACGADTPAPEADSASVPVTTVAAETTAPAETETPAEDVADKKPDTGAEE
jgi:ABC-type glycerol-3-phosphate transport system substrate-binding protein